MPESPTTQPPIISIGIPTYNRATSLRRAIESVQQQDYETLEIIVSDNASTDATPSICQAAAAADRRVRCLHSPENRGATANFNAAAAAATGAFFMWLGDDDWMDAGVVRACYERFLAQPELSLVVPDAVFVAADGRGSPGRPTPPLLDPAPDQRVRRYFRTVFDNSAFYGLIRSGALQAVVPLRDRVGDDWAAVASFAALGPVEVLSDGPRLYRSAGGTSHALRNILRSVRSGRFDRALPYTALACRMAHHIWGHDSFRGIPRWTRRRLGVQVLLTLLVRYWPRQWYQLLWLRGRRTPRR